MPSRSRSSLLAMLCGLGLAACAGATGELAGQPGLLTDLTSYYDRYAMEEGGLCRSPKLGPVTGSSVRQQGADRLIVKVSYVYSDPSVRTAGYGQAGVKSPQPGIAGPSRCRGFGRRDFTVAKRAEGFDVLAMTGLQHRGIRIDKVDDSEVW